MDVLIWFCLVCFIHVKAEAEDSISSVVHQLRILNEEVRQLRTNLPRLEEKLSRDMLLSELSLKDEFSKEVIPRLTKTRVRETLADLFRNTSLDEMVDSQITSEVNDLKDKQGQMVDQYETMSQELVKMRKEFGAKIENLEQETVLLKLALNKTTGKVKVLEDDNSKVMAKYAELQDQVGQGSRIYLVTDKLDNDTDADETNPLVEKTDVNNVLEKVLDTCNRTSERLELLEDQQNTLISFKQNLRCNLEYDYKSPSRLLVTSFHESMTDCYLLDLEERGVTSFPQLKINNILSTTYDPTHDQLLFSRSYPNGIYSMKMDGTGVSLFLVSISSFGMAVDEWQHLVFMTTYKPWNSVSKITTDGQDLTEIADLREKGNYPFGIAIDRNKNMIYMSNYDKVFSVDYEGNNLQVLFEGGNICGVALDAERGLLYFNNESKIMRRSLTGNSSEVVAEAPVVAVDLKYFSNSVYISTKKNGSVYELDLIHVNITERVTAKTKTMLSLIP